MITLLLIALLSIFFITPGEHIAITTQHLNSCTQEVSFIFSLNKKDFLYKDFFMFSTSNPQACVSPWKTESVPISCYDPLFKGTKEIFKDQVKVTVTVTTQEVLNEPVYLCCTYYQRLEKKIKQLEYLLYFESPEENAHNNSMSTLLETTGHQEKIPHFHALAFNVYLTQLFFSITDYLSNSTAPLSLFYCLIVLSFFSVFFLLCLRYARRHLSLAVIECISITSLTIYCIGSHCALYHASVFLPLHTIFFISTITLFSSGIVFIQKSTQLSLKYLCAFSYFFGGLCITATIPLLFKMLQMVYSYFQT